MTRHEQTGANVGYLHQTYHERRSPSTDASSVTRWIISPSILGAALGGAMFAGVGLAGTAVSTFGFVVGLGMFGGGLCGGLMLVIRAVTFDKSAHVVIDERTPVQVETAARPAQTIGGNRPVMVPTQEPHRVEYNGRSYSFSPTQLRLMIDRVEDENTAVSRDAFQIESSAYQDVRYIMSGAGYWRVERTGAEWTPAGIAWLKAQMRTVNA
jgi:hypothetical protein